jgi:hypothetical protein
MVVHFTKRPEAAVPTGNFRRPTDPCPAKAMGPEQRRDMATRVLGGKESASQAARDNLVSRKFVGAQTTKAKHALDEVFAQPPDTPEKVLFWLPVTKSWIEQATIGLALTCKGSERGIVQYFDDHFDYRMSVGKVHNILTSAVPLARVQNAKVELVNIRDAALDELFQAKWPVLAGVDVASTFCFLLSREEHRDADTWGVRLLEQVDRGFAPQSIIADFGGGLRAGVAAALPHLTTCGGDVFHALMGLKKVIRILDNRAYRAIEQRSSLHNKQARQSRRTGRADHSLACQIAHAKAKEQEAIQLADDIDLLGNWLRHDILAVAGPCCAIRKDLFDFVVAEMRQRLDHAGDDGKRIGSLLANHRDDLLAFTDTLDRDIATLAQQFEVEPSLIRELLQHLASNPNHPGYWQREAQFHQGSHGRLHQLKPAVQKLHRQTVRASSVVENLNGRLRGYFSLRRHLGSDYLDLLRFYLNHRRFPRSDRPERKGKSPRELLTGQEHPRWLELLGFQRFERN